MTEEQASALEALQVALHNCSIHFLGVWMPLPSGGYRQVTGASLDAAGDVILGDE